MAFARRTTFRAFGFPEVFPIDEYGIRELLRQKTQAIVKQACAKAGIEIEVKPVVASVFSSDPANPDTNSHFYSDLQMYSAVMTTPDPVAAKANKWQERNITRWQNEEYDRAFLAAKTSWTP